MIRFPQEQSEEEDLASARVIKLGKVYYWKRKPRYLPLRIPSEIAERLIQNHGDPAAWWMGQLVDYLIRPQPWLRDSITKFENTIGFKRPIAG